MKEYSFLDYNNSKVIHEIAVGNYWIPSLKDAITGLKMYRRDYYTKPAAKFIHDLRKGKKGVTYTYNAINGGVIPAADMTMSGIVTNHLQSGGLNIPTFPLPGVSTIDGFKTVFKDSPKQKAEKAKEFFKKPITSTAEKSLDIVTSPFRDIYQIPYYYGKKIYKAVKKHANYGTSLLGRKRNGELVIRDSSKFMDLPSEEKLKIFKMMEKDRYDRSQRLINSGRIAYNF